MEYAALREDAKEVGLDFNVIDAEVSAQFKKANPLAHQVN